MRYQNEYHCVLYLFSKHVWSRALILLTCSWITQRLVMYNNVILSVFCLAINLFEWLNQFSVFEFRVNFKKALELFFLCSIEKKYLDSKLFNSWRFELYWDILIAYLKWLIYQILHLKRIFDKNNKFTPISSWMLSTLTMHLMVISSYYWTNDQTF